MPATPLRKHRVLVTRKLPEAVEKRVAETYEATLNPQDRPIPPEELAARAADHDALLVTSMDKFRADALNALPRTLKMRQTLFSRESIPL